MSQWKRLMMWKMTLVSIMVPALSLLGGAGTAAGQPTTVFSEIPCGVFVDVPQPPSSAFLPFSVPACGGVDVTVTTRCYPLRPAPFTDEPFHTGSMSWALSSRLDPIDPAINPGDGYGRYKSRTTVGWDLLLDFDAPVSAFGMSTGQGAGSPLTYPDRMRLFDGPLGTGNLIAEVYSQGPPAIQYRLAVRFTGYNAGAPIIRSVVIDVQSDQDGLHLDGLAFGSAASGSSAVPEPGMPALARLGAPRPNPMSKSTSFTVELAVESPVRLDLFDLVGRRVRTLVDGVQPAGSHQTTWDGRDGGGVMLPNGIYFARLTASGTRATERIHLVR